MKETESNEGAYTTLTPTRLNRILQGKEGRVTVLAGAGISMVVPSSLPSGHELLKSSLRSLITDTSLTPYLKLFLHHSQYGKVIPETVFQEITDIVGIFPLNGFDSLKHAEPNIVHKILSESALSYGTFINTTNFDLLIEKSSQTPIIVNHIHGRIDEPDSMFTTIRRIGRGMEPSLRKQFASNLINSDLLICLGYSGSDVDVMSVIQDNKPKRIIWVIRDAKDEEWVKQKCKEYSLGGVEYMQFDFTSLLDNDLKVTSKSSRLNTEPITLQQNRLSAAMQAEVLVGCFEIINDYSQALKIIATAREHLSLSLRERISLAICASYALNCMGRAQEAIQQCLPYSYSPACRTGSQLSFRLHTQLGLAYLDSEPPYLESARDNFERALSDAEILYHNANNFDNKIWLGQANHNYGYVETVLACEGDRSSISRAIPFYRYAIGEKRNAGDLLYLQSSLRNLASHLIALNDTPVKDLISEKSNKSPISEFQEFAAICKRYNMRRDYAYFWALTSYLLKTAGRLYDALYCIDRALPLYSELKDSKMVEKLNKLKSNLIFSLQKNQ